MYIYAWKRVNTVLHESSCFQEGEQRIRLVSVVKGDFKFTMLFYLFYFKGRLGGSVC